MKNTLIIFLLFLTYLSQGQNVMEVKRVELSQEFDEIMAELMLNEVSDYYKNIEILENGMNTVENGYEKYRFISQLEYFYFQTKQFEKTIDMWKAAHKEGLFFPFDRREEIYLPYYDIPGFKTILTANDSLKNKATSNAAAEYFVELPANYKPAKKYPLIIILHGGVGNNNFITRFWDSEVIKQEFISVYPRGKQVHGSFAHRFGETGLEDIEAIYRQVISSYPVDTSKIVLAGQSLGGHLSLRLSYDKISAHGLLLAFPVKPGDFDSNRAGELKRRNVRIVMICGEKDKHFFSGQQEMSELFKSAKIENKYITYPELGHGFPEDFSEQIDKGLHYLLAPKNSINQTE